MVVGWREAMELALYGTDGFYARAGQAPADHFRTSVHASPLFAGAVRQLLRDVDTELGHPSRLDVVDVGAGRGELFTALLDAQPPLDGRVRFVAVEVRPRPAGLDGRIEWRRDIPEGIVGLLIATEWLDNVPIDVAEVDDHGTARRVLVDRGTGAETLGGTLDAADDAWLSRWWPIDPTAVGHRIEIGAPRDAAWADAVSRVRRGCALAVDYGHLRDRRPAFGTLTGFRGGRQVEPIPNGSCDVTAHVAMDAVASAAGRPYRLMTQRAALRALGIDGARPPLDLARADPAGYLRALSTASAAAELIEPAGLGGHWWLLHTIGIDLRGSMVA
jgi:SAM-dependent MidA family methyltransferase